MGRGNRQEHSAPHWTDQHPDRAHWTPHQRALARMMTEEAYNGLYGRGPAREEEARATGPLGELSDTELLVHLEEIGAHDNILQLGATASNPDKNNREYRVSVGLSLEDGMLYYEARAEWGPRGAVSRRGRSLYKGSDLNEAIRAANEVINKKLEDGYNEPSFGAASLNWPAVREEAERIAKEG